MFILGGWNEKNETHQNNDNNSTVDNYYLRFTFDIQKYLENK